MKPFALALLLLVAPAVAVEVYKWTDSHGQVHYGDSAPEDRKLPARTVVLREGKLTEAQRQEARERLARDRVALKNASVPVATPAAAASALSLSRPRTEPRTCEEAWKSFHDSHACFNPYRMAGGKVRPEGFLVCQEVLKPPEACR